MRVCPPAAALLIMALIAAAASPLPSQAQGRAPPPPPSLPEPKPQATPPSLVPPPFVPSDGPTRWGLLQRPDACVLVRTYADGAALAVNLGTGFPAYALAIPASRLISDQRYSAFMVVDGAAHRAIIRPRPRDAAPGLLFATFNDMDGIGRAMKDGKAMALWADGKRLIADDLVDYRAALPLADACVAAQRRAAAEALTRLGNPRPGTSAAPPPPAPFAEAPAATGGYSPPLRLDLPNRRAMPANNPASWITSLDYDWRMLQKNAGGETSFRLSVDQDGRATDCAILQSSGYQLLDDRACTTSRRRARFYPATDAQGVPVAGSFDQVALWMIGGDPLLPLNPARVFPPTPTTAPRSWVTQLDLAGGPQAPAPFSTEYKLIVAADGRVSACVPSGQSGLQPGRKAQGRRTDAQTALANRKAWNDHGCALVAARARFAPARGVDGTPVAGEWHGLIVWPRPELAKPEPPQPAPPRPGG